MGPWREADADAWVAASRGHTKRADHDAPQSFAAALVSLCLLHALCCPCVFCVPPVKLLMQPAFMMNSLRQAGRSSCLIHSLWVIGYESQQVQKCTPSCDGTLVIYINITHGTQMRCACFNSLHRILGGCRFLCSFKHELVTCRPCRHV